MIIKLISDNFIFASYDLVVFIELLRGSCALVLALLFWSEPMNCGGRNQPLHKLLSLYLFSVSWYVFDRAFIRMIHIQQSLSTFKGEILLSEIAVSIIILILTIKMSKDYFRYKLYDKINPPKKRRKCDFTCDRHFTVDDKNE